MYTGISRTFLRVLTAIFFVSLFALGASAQGDPDPNSPQPVFLSQSTSTRALAQTYRQARANSDLSRIVPQAFAPDSRVELYISGLSLMDGEDASAFRVYAEDRLGHQYRFPVTNIQPHPTEAGVYRVSTVLTDEIGFWKDLPADGDVLIYVAWRGMGSNRVRLGIGQMGGDIREDAGARPTPLGTKAESKITPSPDYVGYRWSGDRIRFLEQATFGPNLTLDNRIRRIGLRTWINEQFEAQYPSVSNPYPNQPLKANQGQDSLCDGGADDVPVTCVRDSYTMYQPQTWFFREAFYGDAQLRHRVAWALAQIMVTSGNDITQGRHMVEYQKILARNAFGNYRNLMKEMTLNPTMGDYLSMSQSTRISPNENYAREIMQLFTIGLFMLNQDGTLQMSGGNPIPTYDQNGVNNLTKVLTGWTFCNAGLNPCPNAVPATVDYIDPMVLTFPNNNFANNRHDLTAKTLLNYPGSTTTNVAACSNCTNIANTTTYANNSLDQAMDNIFNHPNVGPFVSKILIQHLVTSDPTPAYVGRVAAVFNANRTNPTQMKEVVRAILLDPEARGDVKTDPNYGKLREPVMFFTNFARAFGVRSASGSGLSDGNFTRGRSEFNNMAQVPYMAPTVFNFYPPDYGIPGTTLLGPEFAILTTGTAIARATFINRLTFVNGTAGAAPYPIPFPVAVPDSPDGTSFDFSDLVALSTADSTGGQLVDDLNRRMMHDTMSPAMKSSILTAVTSYGATAHESRVRQALYLIATSSQYQVQR